MSHIFADALSAMPQTLVSTDTAKRLAQLIEPLPAALTRNGIFECPLDIDAPVSDISFSIRAEDGGRDQLAEMGMDTATMHPAIKSPAWKRILSFARSWADPRSPYHESMDHMGLEFDLKSPPETQEAPAVFFSVSTLVEEDFIESNGLPVWTGKALQHLSEQPSEVSPLPIQTMPRLPAGTGIAYAGMMLSRPGGSQAIRLVLCLRRSTLDNSLKALSYPGDIDAVCAMAESLGRFGQLRYSLDMGQTPSPRIGIECFAGDNSMNQSARWQPLLKHCKDTGMVLPGKANAALAWLGPPYSSVQCSRQRFTLYRRISHVKITLDGNKGPSAKIYPEYRCIPSLKLRLSPLFPVAD